MFHTMQTFHQALRELPRGSTLRVESVLGAILGDVFEIGSPPWTRLTFYPNSGRQRRLPALWLHIPPASSTGSTALLYREIGEITRKATALDRSFITVRGYQYRTWQVSRLAQVDRNSKKGWPDLYAVKATALEPYTDQPALALKGYGNNKWTVYETTPATTQMVQIYS